MSPLAGAVLCGGKSIRMGRDKALLAIEGETLLARTTRRLQAACDPVIVASGQRLLEAPGCVVVRDPAPGRGPLAGLVAALQASPHHLCAVVAVDMPDVDPGLLTALAHECEGQDAVVPFGPAGPEPLHAVYARSALPAAEAALASEDRSLKSLLSRLRVLPVDAAAVLGEASSLRFSVNLNRLEDLAAWRRSRCLPL